MARVVGATGAKRGERRSNHGIGFHRGDTSGSPALGRARQREDECKGRWYDGSPGSFRP
jgi:hypothetical protein